MRQSASVRPRKAAVEIAPTTEAAARIIDRAPGAGLLLLDARGRVMHAGAGGDVVSGRGREELVGRPFVDLVDPSDREAALRVLGAPGDDATPPARAVIRLTPPPGGQPRRAVLACWRAAIEGSDAPLVIVLRRTAEGERADARLDRLYVIELQRGAHAVDHFSAWGIEAHLGSRPPDGSSSTESWDMCVAFADRGVYGEAWARAAAGHTVTCTYRVTGYDGETRWILDRCWPVAVGGRQLLYGIVTDVTDHVAPRLTSADDVQVAAAVRAVGDMACVLEATPGRRAEMTYTSKAAETFFGISREPGERLPDAFAAALAPADRDRWDAHLQAVAQGAASDIVVTVRGRDGVARRLWFRSGPAVGPDGGVRGIGLVTDVTAILRETPRLPEPRLEAPPTDVDPDAPALTPRQREILRLLADGRSNEDIAVALGLSRTTVRNHTSGLYARLGVRSRLEAVAVARRLGIVP